MQALRVGRRGRRVVIVTGIVAAVVMGLAAPAWAHHPALSGTTVCTNAEHVVTWTIENSETNHPGGMAIAEATATIGAQSYPVTGYTSPLPNLGTTSATTIVPGDVTGTIKLRVVGVWTADGHTSTRSTTVDLIENCVPQSTTTVTVEGSTTIFTTTSSGGSATTTPITGLGSTVPTVGGQTTVAAGATALPRTGSSSGYPVFFGLSCIAGGALLAIRRRRNWIK